MEELELLVEGHLGDQGRRAGVRIEGQEDLPRQGPGEEDEQTEAAQHGR